jgi:amino acid transporter
VSTPVKNRRRNTVIIVVLVALVAIALVIIGTLTVIGSLDGTLHVDGKATSATFTAGN